MKNKILTTVLMAACVAAAFSSCSKSDAGPVGPDAASGVIMIFQDGMYPNETANPCYDTVIESGYPDSNYSLNTTGWVGNNSGSRQRLLLKFDLSMLPAGSEILSAKVILTVSAVNGGAGSYSMRKLTAAFGESYATWNTRDNTFSWTSAGGDFAADKAGPSVSVADEGAVTWAINAPIVQSWADNPAANHGLIVSSDSETVTGREIGINLSRNSEWYTRPMLVVKYR
ncbi:MAG TPA: DNRLRE domain-containing protein [Candidatus Goldiibacteriota bacterium]|nr:DNRLRE domain-containing protein [Candidatus Goldiibacteriota bacterium]